MVKKTSRQSSNSNIIVMETTGASNDSSDADIYLEEPTETVELPPRRPSQRGDSPSMRSKAPKRASASASATASAGIEKDWNDAHADRDSKYDLTPLGEKNTNRRTLRSVHPSYSIDPYEVTRAKEIARAKKEQEAADESEGYVILNRRLLLASSLVVAIIDAIIAAIACSGLVSSHAVNLPILYLCSKTCHDSELEFTDSMEQSEGEEWEDEIEDTPDGIFRAGDQDGDDPTFLMPGDIHPNMEANADEISQLRLLAGKLSADWRSPDFMAPALARRIRDFQFAQEKRRKKYGDERPWGILGLYDHLASVRIDCQWAEDSALRRANGDSYLSWAEFDESKKGGSNRPYFTYILLVLCTVIMIATIAMNGFKVEPLGENPMIGPSAQTLIKMGAKDSQKIVVEDEGWRLLSSTMLHAGLVHYFINMLALWFVGAAIEMSHGWVAAAIIFTISAVGGAILSAIFLPEYITVGASGGIFGFIGACLADIVMNWKLLFCDLVSENGTKHRHAIVVVVLLLDIGLNSIIGLTPFVDNFTRKLMCSTVQYHSDLLLLLCALLQTEVLTYSCFVSLVPTVDLGGMMYGFFCGMSTMGRLSTDFFGLEEGMLPRTKHFIARFFGVIISVAAIIATLVILLNGDGETDPCPACTWLSCVPFPPWEADNSKWWYCDDCNRVTADIVVEPELHLDLYCPNGNMAYIDLTGENSVGRDSLEKKLPSFCREYCSAAEENLN
jgi:membrane associated rhomboid family serine protease